MAKKKKKHNSADSKTQKTSADKTKSFSFSLTKGIWPVVWVLLIAVLLLYSSFIFSGNMLYGSDQVSAIDHKSFYSNEIKGGNFPLWVNTRLAGMPTVDAMFGDAFYPVNVLFSMIFPVHRTFGYKTVLHVFLAGLFFFLLLQKGFRLEKWLSLLGAMLYMLNVEFVSHTYPGHEGKMFVIALLPLVMWMLERLIQKQTLWRSALLGISIGLCLLTSHIQMTYFVLWGLFAYIVFRIIFIVRDEQDKNKALRLFGYFWAGVFLGLGVGMIQLLAPYMFVREGLSVRGPHKGFEYAASWSLHWEEAFSLIVPEFGNTLENYWGQNYFKLNQEYVGLMANLLFVFSLVLFFDKVGIFWLIVSVFALLYSLGAHTPVLKLCYYLVPGVKSFRAPSMIMFWFSFALVMNGIRGLSRFLADAPGWNHAKKEKYWKRMLVACGIIGGVCIILSIGQSAVTSVWQSVFYTDMSVQKAQVMTANYPNFIKGLWIFGVLTSASLLALGSYMRGQLKRNMLIGILFLIGFADLWRNNAVFIKSEDPMKYMSVDPAILRVKNDPETKRVFDLPGTYNHNFVGIFGLESVAGFHDNELRWYREFRGEQSQNLMYHLNTGDIGSNPFLNLLNVKYLMHRPGRGQPVNVYQNSGCMPRTKLFEKYEVLPGSLAVPKIRSGIVKYREIILLDQEPGNIRLKPDTSAIGTTVYTRKSSDQFEIKVQANRDCILFVSEVYYPGWKAVIDEQPAEILLADGALMAIAVPGGQHTVVFSMHSKYLKLGTIITVLSLVLISAMGLLGFLQSRKEKPDLSGNQEPKDNIQA